MTLEKCKNKYTNIHIDGSLSQYGGSVGCFSYSNGKHKIIELSSQNDSLGVEYSTFIALLIELNEIKDNLPDDCQINVVTDSQPLFKEFNGEKKTSRPKLLERVLDLVGNLNICLKWMPRNKNRAGKILEDRIKSLRIARKANNGKPYLKEAYRYYKR